jgi:raffinose/stachyose/melibiose transport system substrate-binding protein
MKKSLVGIVSVLLLAGIPFLGFTGGQTEGEATAPVTVIFVLKSTTIATPYEQIFANYEQKTGNKVEIQVLPAGEDYGRLMLTRFATNDYPDVFQMDPGTKQYIKFRASETLYDWTNDPIVDKFTDSMREFQTLDGRIYGVPWGSTGNLGVYYNKDVFNAVGVGIPQDYREFLTVCRKVKAAGYTSIYEAVKTEWPAQIFSLAGWVSYVDPEIGDEGVMRLETNKLRLNQIPAFKRVLEEQVALKDLGYYQDNLLAGTYEEQQEQFGTGKVAMVFHGAWLLNVLAEKFSKDFVNNKVGWFPLPGENNPGIACLYAAGQLLVPRLTENVDTAVDLVRFMTEKESLDVEYTANPGIPVYKNAESDLYPAQEAVFEMVQADRAKINIQNRLSSSFTDYPKILQQMFIDGEVQAALDRLDENYRRTGKARQLPGF